MDLNWLKPGLLAVYKTMSCRLVWLALFGATFSSSACRSLDDNSSLATASTMTLEATPDVRTRRLKTLTSTTPYLIELIEDELVYIQNEKMHRIPLREPNLAMDSTVAFKLPPMWKNHQLVSIHGLTKAGKVLVTARTFDGNVPTSSDYLLHFDPTTRAIVDVGRNLESCLNTGGQTFCERLIFDQATLVGARLFTNAGGCESIRYTDDLGASWHTVLGDGGDGFGSYTSYFTFVDGHIVSGGECPLDNAFVRVYKSNADWTAVTHPTPIPQIGDDIGNRRVYVIKQMPNKRIFAGAEGAILELVGDNFTVKYRFQHPIEGENYPYYTGFAFSQTSPGKIVAFGIGNNKRSSIIASLDGGATWHDVTQKIMAGRTDLVVRTAAYDAVNRRFVMLFGEIADKNKVYVEEVLIGD